VNRQTVRRWDRQAIRRGKRADSQEIGIGRQTDGVDRQIVRCWDMQTDRRLG
jgi:hypothetical protein